MRSPSLRALSISTVLAFCVSLSLVFFYAPIEAEEGFVQKIFYLHVPLAIVTLAGFVIGGLFAIAHLRTRDARWDLRSYVAIHMSLIFGIGVLITGSIWAHASWGHWWVWNEPTLVSFLIIMLLYATYQPLRFAILVSLVAMALLYATLCSYELAAKRTRILLKARSRILGFQ